MSGTKPGPMTAVVRYKNNTNKLGWKSTLSEGCIPHFNLNTTSKSGVYSTFHSKQSIMHTKQCLGQSQVPWLQLSEHRPLSLKVLNCKYSEPLRTDHPSFKTTFSETFPFAGNFFTLDTERTIVLNNGMGKSFGYMGDISVKIVWGESVKQLGTTSLNSSDHGQKWRRSCIVIQYIKKLWICPCKWSPDQEAPLC